MGIIKTDSGYEFIASDGGLHSRQMWHGHWVGNNKYGSFVTTTGTLDNPLGSGDPQDISVSPNPDPAVNPIYPSYGYMGGGPVYQVPGGMPGAGNLLATYHGELPNDALYAALGLVASSDNGQTWTDLGEIIRLKQSYAAGLDGFEIGDGPLALSPDGKYFYCIFPTGSPAERFTSPRRRTFPLRVPWPRPYSKPLSDRNNRARSPSKSFMKATGICNQRSAALPQTLFRSPPTRAISISATTERYSAM